MVFAADRLPAWVLDDPARMAGAVRLMSIAVVAKCWLAASSWRRVSARHLRQYLLVWGAATACLLTLTTLFGALCGSMWRSTFTASKAS